MDQRRHVMQRQAGEGGQGQSVDQFHAVGGKRRPGRPRGIDRGLVGVGQPSGKFHHLHGVAQRAQAIGHAAIIGVAPGDGREAARERSGKHAWREC